MGPPPGSTSGTPNGSRLAPRPRWPRYCFTFPGKRYFLAGLKEKRERDTGAPLSLPGRACRASDRPGEGSRADPERSRRRARRRRRPSRRPPRAPAPFAAALPAPPARPPDTNLAAGPLPARVGPSALPPGARLWGRTALLPLLPQLHRQPRSGPPPGPAPFTRPAAPGPAERGEKAAASARGDRPRPAPLPTTPSRTTPSHHPSHHPSLPPDPRRRATALGAGLGLRAQLVAPSPAPAGGKGHLRRTWAQLAWGPGQL